MQAALATTIYCLPFMVHFRSLECMPIRSLIVRNHRLLIRVQPVKGTTFQLLLLLCCNLLPSLANFLHFKMIKGVRNVDPFYSFNMFEVTVPFPIKKTFNYLYRCFSHYSTMTARTHFSHRHGSYKHWWAWAILHCGRPIRILTGRTYQVQ
jgi:hypothetical protein